MSWLGRLIGRSQPPAPALPAGAVVLPEDVVAALTAEGAPLAAAAVAALREHLAERETDRAVLVVAGAGAGAAAGTPAIADGVETPSPPAAADGEAATVSPSPGDAANPPSPSPTLAPKPSGARRGDRPFWLDRDAEPAGADIEEALRDRVAQRRAEEGDDRS